MRVVFTVLFSLWTLEFVSGFFGRTNDDDLVEYKHLAETGIGHNPYERIRSTPSPLQTRFGYKVPTKSPQAQAYKKHLKINYQQPKLSNKSEEEIVPLSFDNENIPHEYLPFEEVGLPYGEEVPEAKEHITRHDNEFKRLQFDNKDEWAMPFFVGRFLEAQGYNKEDPNVHSQPNREKYSILEPSTIVKDLPKKVKSIFTTGLKEVVHYGSS